MPVIKVVVTAGGTSNRFGSNKLFEKLKGKFVVQYSVDLFTSMGFEVVIPANKTFLDDMKDIFKLYPNVRVTEGGATRQESVYKGIIASGKCDYVIIHDAARPLIKKETVEKALDKVYKEKAVIVAVKTTDTIKETDENKKITATPDRSKLINVQTPQIFEYNLILNAHKKLAGQSFTDDARLVEQVGNDVFYSDGEYSNIKITNQLDLKIAEILLETP